MRLFSRAYTPSILLFTILSNSLLYAQNNFSEIQHTEYLYKISNCITWLNYLMKQNSLILCLNNDGIDPPSLGHKKRIAIKSEASDLFVSSSLLNISASTENE